jgi:hypothetical protein
MSIFNIHLMTAQPDRLYVEVDHRFDVVIVRTETGLSFRVYPRTDGESWRDPFTTFELDERDIQALEKKIKSDTAARQS